MIAHQDNDSSALAGRIFLKRHQEIHDLPRFGTPVEKITKLDQRCAGTCPSERAVDQVGSLQNSGKCIEIAMNISDRDNPLGGCGRRDREKEAEKSDRERKSGKLH
jgi:hypothetical protein